MSDVILTARASAASASAAGGSAGQQALQYLTFVSSGEVFALGILSIKEIIEYTQLTVVPMTPDFVRGVMNLRGAVVPVVDLSVRFGRPASPVSRRTCIVIVEVPTAQDSVTIGIVVDAVNAVVDILPAQIEPPPSFGAHVRTEFIEGMGRINERFVILLNVERIAAMDEIMLAAAGTAASSGHTGAAVSAS
jgi:purine-binding chemotaxis protein CheW